MALVSPGIQISVNDQSQYVGANTGSVPLVLLATAQNKTYNGAAAVGTSKANAGKLLSFTSQRDLVTAMGTPTFQLSSAGTPVNASEINEYGLLTAYSALGLGNRLFAIRADVDLNQLKGTSVRPTGSVADGTFWLDLANTEFGIYELDSPASTFGHINPLLITDPTQVFNDSGYAYNVPTPKASVGQQGAYALVFTSAVGDTPATPDAIRFFYKTDNTALDSGNGGPGANTWVQVGSLAWQKAIVTTLGSAITATIPDSSNFTINGHLVSIVGSGPTYTIADVAYSINTTLIPGVKARTINGKLAIYVTDEADSHKMVITDGTNTPLSLCGITPGSNYYAPALLYGSYANNYTAEWFATGTTPRPSGSVWWKTTSTGTGYTPALKKYSTSLSTWVSEISPMYTHLADAIYNLDPVGGGIGIQQGQIISLNGSTDTTVNNLLYVQVINSGVMIANGSAPALSTGNIGHSFVIESSIPGQSTPLSTTITLTGGTAETFVSDILNQNIPYVTSQVNVNGTISLSHTAGGYILLTELTGTAITDAGFVDGASPYIQIFVNNTAHPVLLSNFSRITTNIQYSTTTPYAAPGDGTLWYYSNPADIDIMVNNNGWKGYKNVHSDVRGYNLQNTDSNGVIVSAGRPTSQSDGSTSIQPGDLWLDSSDLENYPALYRWNGTVWVVIDKADHISSNGIIFADARWDSNGTTDPVSGTLPAISTLLTSDYLDLDAPDYRLYPRGTLLFNTRRSGYNVKKFVGDYFNSTSFPPNSSNTIGLPTATPSITNAWVTDSGLKEDGSMYAGSAAQRAIVVAALKSAIDSNTDILDANYNFNLLVAPGYTELIPNLVTLNDNRSNTAFVIGDTPMTLSPNSTDITAWNSNTNGNGLPTSSAYLGIYYPSGLTTDLAGNSVVVPASHAVLRTFLYNDNVGYPWFAPAGVHRGLVSNINDIGYVNTKTGAFVHNGINQGLRDTLYTLSINPITQLPGTGIVVWGQETKSGDTTARNRVNVVRLENYLRTIFNTIANSFLFEPNDTITRKSIATQIESSLHDLLSKRGVYDFLVICDTSNNTPSTIANNQLYVDVAIEPMRDVEFIYIPIALYNPGTVASLGAAST